MMTKEQAVRTAARDLAAAIEAATAAGYRIDWPASPSGLAGIGISATGAVVEAKPEKAAGGKSKLAPAGG